MAAESKEPLLITQNRMKEMLHEALSEELNNLLEQQLLVDLVVIVEGQRFPCHSVVLASLSGYIRSMLTSSWKESTSREVTLDGDYVTKESFQQILNLIYKKETTLSYKIIKAILKSAIYLQMKRIEIICIKFLCDTLKPEACLELWEFAEEHDLGDLALHVFTKAVTDFAQVIQHEEFLNLPKAKLLKLASRLCLDLDKNTSLCNGILNWVTADWDHRSQHLGELLIFVNFPLLPPGEISHIYKNPSIKCHCNNYLKECISEALTYHLEGTADEKAEIMREIRSHQINASPGLDLCRSVLVLGGYSGDDTFFTLKTFSVLDRSKYIMHTLNHVPWTKENLRYAACLWRNDIFVSGGSENPTVFAVYSPFTGSWTKMDKMPHGRKNHTMAAINSSILIIGGNDPTLEDAESKPCVEILVYKLQTKTWSTFGYLKVPVHQAPCAVLGHRVYIFGGKDGEDKSTDGVQCLDTLRSKVYMCGRLPTPTFGAQAVSDGGTVFVLTTEGQLLEMLENFTLADKIELHIRENDNDQTKPADMPEVMVSGEKDEETPDTSDIRDSDENALFTVRLKRICQLPPRQHFGIYSNKDKIVVLGGQDDDGKLLYHTTIVNLVKSQWIPHPTMYTFPFGMAYISAFIVNIPEEFLPKDRSSGQTVLQFCLCPDKLPLTFNFTVRNINWRIKISHNTGDDNLYAELLDGRLSNVDYKISCWLMTNTALEKAFCTFNSSNYKVYSKIAMKDLTARNSPYLESGEAKLKVIFSF